MKKPSRKPTISAKIEAPPADLSPPPVASPYRPTYGDHAARLLNFALTDPALSCSCVSCARKLVILTLPARIIATVERLSDDDVAGITAATINMLVDLEAVEAAELVQSRRLVEQDDDIPF